MSVCIAVKRHIQAVFCHLCFIAPTFLFIFEKKLITTTFYLFKKIVTPTFYLFLTFFLLPQLFIYYCIYFLLPQLFMFFLTLFSLRPDLRKMPKRAEWLPLLPATSPAATGALYSLEGTKASPRGKPPVPSPLS